MSSEDPAADPTGSGRPGDAPASVTRGVGKGTPSFARKDASTGGAATGGSASGGGAGDEVPAEERAARRREHAVRGALAAALILEGITVLFVPQTIAAIGEHGLGGTRLLILLVLAAALFVAAGLQRRSYGLLLGSVLQVAVILTGLTVAAMYFLGLLFAAVWGFLLWVRQEVGRAAARAAAGQPPA